MLPGLRARPFDKTPPALRTAGPLGQCRLSKSGANLLLSRFQGMALTINGLAQVIPAAGVTLAATGLAAGTLYYIYACMGGSGMMLEASTVGHATDAATGAEIKTGDPTRTLVGMARPIAGPAWQDAPNQRFVVSWFNQRPIHLVGALGTSQGNTSTGAYAPVSNAAFLLEFISFAGTVASRFQGRVLNNVVNAFTDTATFLNGANSESYCGTQVTVVNAAMPVFCALDTTVGEGYNSFNVYSKQDVASIAMYTGGIVGSRCVHSGVIQG